MITAVIDPSVAAPTRILGRMPSLADASLSAEERAVLERFVELLRARLGDELRAVWLFGSRARGEPVSELSDIDLLVLARRTGWDDASRVYGALHDAACSLSLPDVAWSFSVHVHDPDWLKRRRAVESFFAAEVDRDHIELVSA